TVCPSPTTLSPACYVAYMHNGWDSAKFRDLLKRIMDETGLSQRDVADLAGISRPQVSRWLSGAHRPNFDALQKFATAARRYPGQEDAVAGLLAAAGYPDAVAAGDSAVPSPGGLPVSAPEPRYADPRLQHVNETPDLDPEGRELLVRVTAAILA